MHRRLEVEVTRDSKFLMVEPIVFGREASGEILQFCSLDDRVCITTEGTPIYVDRIKLDGDVALILKRSAVAAGLRAMASIVLVDKMAKAMIDGVAHAAPFRLVGQVFWQITSSLFDCFALTASRCALPCSRS